MPPPPSAPPSSPMRRSRLRPPPSAGCRSAWDKPFCVGLHSSPFGTGLAVCSAMQARSRNACAAREAASMSFHGVDLSSRTLLACGADSRRPGSLCGRGSWAPLTSASANSALPPSPTAEPSGRCYRQVSASRPANWSRRRQCDRSDSEEPRHLLHLHRPPHRCVTPSPKSRLGLHTYVISD